MVSEKARTKAKNRRDDLPGEHAFGDAGQIILACLFVGVWIADTFFFQYTTFLNRYIPLEARIPSGVLLFILSVYLARTGLAIVFGDRREKPAVIRKSVFGVVRHPVYLSEILFYLSLLMLSLSLAYEEKLLLARFGEDYAKYLREVPMWLPQSSLPPVSQQCIPRIPENQKARPAPGYHQFPGKIQPKQERSHFWG